MLLENVSFKGKTGIITGGAQGIGKAIASQLVAMGGRAVIVDINPVTGEETCRELGNAAFYAVDLADAGQVVRVFEQIIADEKHVDVLINNAGIVNTDDFQDLSLEQWNKILAVDLTAVFLACQVCFRHMAEIGGGRITGTEYSPEHPEGISFGMYHTGQYAAPDGEHQKVFSADGVQWYKQYAVDTVIKKPFTAPDGEIDYHKEIVKKMPDPPKRKDRM